MLTKRSCVQDEIILSTLEELVPKNHLVRKLDKIDYSFIYDIVSPYYSTDGRPSIDPVILIKILVIKHFFNINSIRKTMKEIEVNIAYRWFLKIPMSEKIPHHTVVSTNYNNRFKQNLIFERIFKTIIQEALNKKIVCEREFNYKVVNLELNKNKVTEKTRVKINEQLLYFETLV